MRPHATALLMRDELRRAPAVESRRPIRISVGAEVVGYMPGGPRIVGLPPAPPRPHPKRPPPFSEYAFTLV